LPDISARIVPNAMEWIKSPFLLLLPKKLGLLMERLAKGGQVEEAFHLAQALLDVTKYRHHVGTTKDLDEKILLSPEARALIDDWEYGEILDKNIQSLISVNGIRTLGLLCDLLDKTLRLEEFTEPEDGSHVWCTTIEQNGEDIPHGIKDYLVPAIKDCAEKIIQEEPSKTQAVLDTLVFKPFKIFRRIELHLLRIYHELDPPRVNTRLTDRTLFDDETVSHEYTLLAQSQFGALPEEDKETILNWIKAGPDIEEFRDQAMGKTSPFGCRGGARAWSMAVKASRSYL